MDAEPHDEMKGFRRRWSMAFRAPANDTVEDICDDQSVHQLSEPIDLDPYDAGSRVESESVEHTAPTGLTCTKEDSENAVASAFFRNMKWSDISMPWEQGYMRALFEEDPNPVDAMSMPSSWNVVRPEEAVEPSCVQMIAATSSGAFFTKSIRSIKDSTFLEDRATAASRAATKWHIIIGANYCFSKVGKQIAVDVSNAELIIESVIGTKSPSTALGRANAMLSYMRWYCTSFDPEAFLPIDETSVWSYLMHLRQTGAPATKASSFVQALRFSHFFFGIEGCLEAFSSRRVTGSAELMLAGKCVTKQARPLTVQEVRRLHTLASDTENNIVDRVIAAHCLLMIYGRCRHSDTTMVDSISHDHSASTGFVQINTRFHKACKTALKKNLLLPILIPAAGVGGRPWPESWWEARIEAGLPTDGAIQGPLLPAPSLDGRWTRRPLTCSELTSILRSMLGAVGDDRVTSHSLKTTTLSWAAKGNLDRETRRLLGRHASAIQTADSVYSRDLAYNPAMQLASLLEKIKAGKFVPDAPRTFFFPDDAAVDAHVESKSTPLPMTPRPVNLIASAPDKFVGANHTVFSSASVKEEEPATEASREHVGVFDISSTSESDTSDSKAESQSSEEQGLSSVEDEPMPKRKTLEVTDDDNGCKLVQNQITKTIHKLDPTAEDMTRCGRKRTDKMADIQIIRDWPHKCRLCFRGRRQPQM